jgi:hypothetical protein
MRISPMDDEHPLEQLLREAKKKDDLKAAAVVAEQRKASDLRDKVRLQWEQTKAGLIEEIARANAVLQRHGLSEQYTLRDLSESGTENIARCNLALAYPTKSPRSEYDLTVLAADGQIILLHRATGQRHQKLTVFTATRRNWENILIGLYEDHLKKGREPGPNIQSATSDSTTPTARRKSP